MLELPRSLVLIAVGLLLLVGASACDVDDPTDPTPADISCDGGLFLCGERCVDLDSDLAHCGDCDTACGAEERCVAGSCTEPEPTCPEGQERCGEDCVDTSSDRSNCGACGKSCQAGERCEAHACLEGCGEDERLCGEACVDTQSDDQNCGDCGVLCGEGEVCAEGSCELRCDGGLEICSDACVDTESDPLNCGGCGVECGEDQVCSADGCVLSCDGGLEACEGACVDTDSNEDHCGACGVSCGDDQRCDAGSCVSRCAEGTEFCNGACVATSEDVANCGGCGVECVNGELCALGICTSSCGELRSCGSACADISTDRLNCGGCDIVCKDAQLCELGQCLDRCPAGQDYCIADGSCAETMTDRANCGACGKVCAGNEACHSGICVSQCESIGETYCQESNLCAMLESDAKNCGECGKSCREGESCQKGSCEPSCPKGQTLCGDKCVSAFDQDHCGECFNQCKDGFSCDGKECVSQCEVGETYCPGGRSDEDGEKGEDEEAEGRCTVLEKDPYNCLGCGIRCAVEKGEQCSEKGCVNQCKPGDNFCQGRCSDPLSDSNNCGGCGGACKIEDVCKEGKCVSRCGPTELYCDGACVAQDGLDHCGKCTNSCKVGMNNEPVCKGGECGWTCNEGWAECKNKPGECTIDLMNDPENCGGCEKACDKGLSCLKGACVKQADREIVKLTAGKSHTCALVSDGRAWCWGQNNRGQLGVGDTTIREAPTLVQGLSGLVDIAAGDEHTCAVDERGKTWCWGRGGDQLGPGWTSSITATAIEVTGLEGMKMITSGLGGRFGCAAGGEKDELWCWGAGNYGQLGDGQSKSTATPVAAGLGSIRSIKTTEMNSYAVQSDGAIWAWGFGFRDGGNADGGSVNVPAPQRPKLMPKGVWLKVGGGKKHACAINDRGELYCWGVNDQGQIVYGGEKNEDVIVTPVQIPVEGRTEEVAGGLNFTCAINEKNFVYCWGNADHGRVGTGLENGIQEKPEQIKLDREVKYLTAGESHACASDGKELWCWGNNAQSQLTGKGDRAVPGPAELGGMLR